ncbi:MAG: universal stress protein [Betaproteobacteria bacterium]
MCRILLPVDGSDNSDRAVRLMITLHAKLAPVDLHLIHVQVPEILNADKAVSEEALNQRVASTGDEALRSARALLDDAGISYASKAERGYVASSVVAYAKANRCDGIIMGTRGMGSTEQMLGSIARQVIYLSDVPVTLVK